MDKRTDIWAFGVVLYELSTGKRLFKGEDISDTLASVLKEEPDFAPVPERLRPLPQSCLQKDPKKRLRDIADAMRLVLESAPQPVATRRASLVWPAVAALLAVGLGLALWNPWRAEPPLPPVTQFEIEMPQNATGPQLSVVSPDGRRIAFADFNRALFVHSLDSGETRELTQAGYGVGLPFWSPDSRWLVYPAADGTAKKIDVRGGPPQTVCPGLTQINGGAWSAKGEVLVMGVGAQGPGMLRVTPSGCQPIGGTGLRAFPALLPDGRRFTYVGPVEDGGPGVFLGSLDAGEGESTPEPLAAIDTGNTILNTGYVPSAGPGHGHILYVQGGDLLARPFDESKGRFAGEAVALAGIDI